VGHRLRPWGAFTTIGAGPAFRVREVSIDPGARMVRQRHPSRDRHWIVVSGRARLEVDGGTRELGPGQAAVVPRGAVNRLANAGPGPLQVIEVALGDVLSDDAAERFPD
jgi:mannose-6-phosphate isomerase-like protein (cupin superfamily)